MFTGLIRTQGTIRRVDQRGDCMMTIAMREPFAVEVGDSIACHGICLTAIKVAEHEFKVSLSAETMACTNAGGWAVGTEINLEPSLRIGDALGGHFVSGHVDGLARVAAHEKSGDSTIWEFEVPTALARFIAPKGSIVIDGVSLTVNTVESRVEGHAEGREAAEKAAVASASSNAIFLPSTRPATPNAQHFFTVNIIPHTAKVTSFGHLAVGDKVNIEIDMLARYVARLMEQKS